MELQVTDIISFVRLQFCDRHLAFRQGKARERVAPILARFPVGMDPTHQEVGLGAEEALERLLAKEGVQEAGRGLSWKAWCARLQEARPGVNLYAREVEIEGRVGAFALKGRMDFVLLLWQRRPSWPASPSPRSWPEAASRPSSWTRALAPWTPRPWSWWAGSWNASEARAGCWGSSPMCRGWPSASPTACGCARPGGRARWCGKPERRHLSPPSPTLGARR